jgi:hypothetical protein
MYKGKKQGKQGALGIIIMLSWGGVGVISGWVGGGSFSDQNIDDPFFYIADFQINT